MLLDPNAQGHDHYMLMVLGTLNESFWGPQEPGVGEGTGRIWRVQSVLYPAKSPTAAGILFFFFLRAWMSVLGAGIYFLGHQWLGMPGKSQFQEAKMR